SLKRQENPYYIHNGYYTHNSLYPSIIMQFQLNSEKLGGNDIILPNGVRLSNHSEGFTVELLKGYFEKRKYYKKLMLNSEPDSEEYKTYHLKQWAHKINLNSFYGYLGYPKARLFNIDIAKSIPYMGRIILRHMKSIVEGEGFAVISGDTDSLYVQMKTDNLNEIIDSGKLLTRKINESFDKFVLQFGCEKNNYLEIQFEKINKKMFFGAGD
ncbi:MAG: DNA polymerase domain-containing protein, partial [Nanoarchaeota archaeon]